MSTIELKPAPRREINDELLKEIVGKIVAAFNPRRIVLFGSRARGKEHAESDLDLFVEMEAFADEPRWKRRIRVDELFRLRSWSMDILVYTPEEVAKRRNSLASIVPVIEREGKILHERAER